MPCSRGGRILPCLPVNERKPIEALQVPAKGLEVGHHLGPPVPIEPLGPPPLAPAAQSHGLRVPVASRTPRHSSCSSRPHLIPGGRACDRPSPSFPQLNPADVSSSVAPAGHGGCWGMANPSPQVRVPPWGQSHSGHGTGSTSVAPAKASHRRCAAISRARVLLSLPTTAPGSIK